MAARIPFSIAIADKHLLKPWADKLSMPQRAALKIFYGCDLTDEELEFWAISQGRAVFDELGYPTEVDPLPYEPKEYERAIAVFGRRAGKTDRFSATIVAYEATCGGHEDYVGNLKQRPVCFLIAQDLKMAKEAKGMIEYVLSTSPVLSKEVASDPTADFIPIRNGIWIGVAPPTVKAVRGFAAPVVVMDEVGIWHKTAEAANPDYEVERAVRFAQGQFPSRKRVLISTPYVKEGLLYDYAQKGTQGNTLYMNAPTASVRNPLITREWLAAERVDDAEAFERECLARFVDAVSGFLSPPLLQEAVSPGVTERTPDELPSYVAAIDPAFRHDAFAFTIVHHDADQGVVQDVVRYWQSPDGVSLNPSEILAEIAPILRAFRISTVVTDQYQLESLKQLALGFNISLYGVDFTARSKAKILGSLQQLLNQKRLHLLDNRRQMQELLQLERRYTSSGGVQIAAPRGRHDDMATVLALACHEAVWMFPSRPRETKQEPTLSDLCWATIRKRKAELDYDYY